MKRFRSARSGDASVATWRLKAAAPGFDIAGTVVTVIVAPGVAAAGSAAVAGCVARVVTVPFAPVRSSAGAANAASCSGVAIAPIAGRNRVPLTRE